MHNISKKTCFPSTRKVLDFDLNGQHMRKTEVPEGNWVLGCYPDHSTIRPKILRVLSLSQVRKTCFSTKGRKQWFSFACGVFLLLLILSILQIYFVHDCRGRGYKQSVYNTAKVLHSSSLHFLKEIIY